jgi:hypothetical protein
MDKQDIDHLLEQGLSGDPPRRVFRVRVLMDSTEAFLRARRGGLRWRLGVLSAAAVFIAGVSFLLGRYSAPPPAVNEVTANASDTVVVAGDLVVWLEAARLFQQLGMEDRMHRALDRAARLLPGGTIIADDTREGAFPAAASIENREERISPVGRPDANPSVQNVNQILARAFGD